MAGLKDIRLLKKMINFCEIIFCKFNYGKYEQTKADSIINEPKRLNQLS